MPFDWLHPTVNESFTASLAGRARESQRREVRDRAGILMRLRRSEAQAVRRCSDNLSWEFELTKPPAVLGEVGDLVQSIYRRG